MTVVRWAFAWLVIGGGAVPGWAEADARGQERAEPWAVQSAAADSSDAGTPARRPRPVATPPT